MPRHCGTQTSSAPVLATAHQTQRCGGGKPSETESACGRLAMEKALRTLIDSLPKFATRHNVRITTRDMDEGMTENEVTELFADINQLSKMIQTLYKMIKENHGSQFHRFPVMYQATELFAACLDHLNCKSDAWKTRLRAKEMFPKKTIDTSQPSPSQLLVPITLKPNMTSFRKLTRHMHYRLVRL